MVLIKTLCRDGELLVILKAHDCSETCSCDHLRDLLFKDHLVMSQLWLYHAFF